MYLSNKKKSIYYVSTFLRIEPNMQSSAERLQTIANQHTKKGYKVCPIEMVVILTLDIVSVFQICDNVRLRKYTVYLA